MNDTTIKKKTHTDYGASKTPDQYNEVGGEKAFELTETLKRSKYYHFISKRHLSRILDLRFSLPKQGI
jgi:hypothetical protein